MSNPRSRRSSLGILAVGLALALTACAGEASDPTTDGNGGDGSRDATLALGVQAAPNSLDPAQLHDGLQRYVWGSLYDTLIYSDHDGELAPAAAESWEYSEDALTLTLQLRDDMTFRDGDPVTAEAVKSTLERTKATAGPQQNNLAAVDSVEAPEDHTVVLNLAYPDPNLLVSLSYASGTIADPETLDGPETALNPVASGPYVLNEDRTINGTSYVLDRRDDHWNAEAYPFKTITVRVIQDRTALFNALLAGELDAGTVDGTQAEQAKAGGMSVERVDGTSIAGLVLADRDGTVVPELADVRVRQAINMALDKEGILNGIVLGNGATTSQVFSEFSPAYDQELDEVYPFDPEGARELLEEAGYSDGFTLSMPATLTSTPFQPTISQSLRDVGIDVQWDPVPPQSAGQSTKWGAYWNFGAGTAASRTAAVYYRAAGSQNPFQYEDPDLQDLFDQLDAETDANTQDQILGDINQFGVDEAWFAPVLSQATLWASVPTVDYVGSGISLSDVRNFDSIDE